MATERRQGRPKSLDCAAEMWICSQSETWIFVRGKGRCSRSRSLGTRTMAGDAKGRILESLAGRNADAFS